MHPFQGKSVAIGCPVVYYAWTAHAFSAGIICLHCISELFTLLHLQCKMQLWPNNFEDDKPNYKISLLFCLTVVECLC